MQKELLNLCNNAEDLIIDSLDLLDVLCGYCANDEYEIYNTMGMLKILNIIKQNQKDILNILDEGNIKLFQSF